MGNARGWKNIVKNILEVQLESSRVVPNNTVSLKKINGKGKNRS